MVTVRASSCGVGGCGAAAGSGPTVRPPRRGHLVTADTSAAAAASREHGPRKQRRWSKKQCSRESEGGSDDVASQPFYFSTFKFRFFVHRGYGLLLFIVNSRLRKKLDQSCFDRLYFILK